MTHVIGHRGASWDHPENTIAAFTAARSLGADGVELDVRRSSDGYLVVHHDAHLGDGRAIAATARIRLPDSVPGLDEALAACATMQVNVEIKNSEGEPGFDSARTLADSTLEVIAESKVDCLVSSFDLDTINRIRAIDPSMPTGYLVLSCDEPIDAVATCIDHGHVAVHPYDLFVDRALVERCHAVGVAVNVWTVDQPDRIAELLTFGVDAVISNRVDVALAVRART